MRAIIIALAVALTACGAFDIFVHGEVDASFPPAGDAAADSTVSACSMPDAAEPDAPDAGPAVDAADASDASDAADGGDGGTWWFESTATVVLGDSTVEPWYMTTGVPVSWSDEVPRTYGPVLTYGLSGQDCTALITTSGLAAWSNYGSAYQNRVAFVWCGGNDVYHGYTAEQAWGHVCDVAAAARSAGFSRVIGGTLLDRNWTTAQAVVAAELASIEQTRRAECLDDLGDVASDPLLGAPGARLGAGAVFFRDVITHPSRRGMSRLWELHFGPAYWRAIAAFRATP